MNQDDLQVFINGTVNYFDEITGEKAIMGVPYIKGDESVLLDFTGVIGISGDRKGGVYITTPREMIIDLVKKILGDDDLSSDTLNDMIGEIANTISGNAREVFGSNFMISVPIVLEGKPHSLKLPLQSFVIPIKWSDYKSYLVIGLE